MGGSCDPFSFSCVSGLTCVPSDDGSSGACLASKNLGEACTLLYECGGTASSSLCDESIGKCVARPSSGPCIGGLCNALTSFCSKGTCTSFLAVGASCDPSVGGACGLTNECQQAGAATTGTCVTPGACTP